MTVSTLITRIRRRLDQVPPDPESVQTESEVLGSVSTNFGDDDLINRINKANFAIVSQCKAQHVPQAVEKKTSVSGVENDAIRILPRRVFVSTDTGSTYVRAFRRSVDMQRRLQSRLSSPGREGTSDYPVYTYEDGDFNTYPDPSVTGYSLKAYIVAEPSVVTATGDTNPVDERFERAIVDYVVASCYQTMRKVGLSEFFQQIFKNDIRPFRRDIRYGAMDDQEVDVE